MRTISSTWGLFAILRTWTCRHTTFLNSQFSNPRWHQTLRSWRSSFSPGVRPFWRSSVGATQVPVGLVCEVIFLQLNRVPASQKHWLLRASSEVCLPLNCWRAEVFSTWRSHVPAFRLPLPLVGAEPRAIGAHLARLQEGCIPTLAYLFFLRRPARWPGRGPSRAVPAIGGDRSGRADPAGPQEVFLRPAGVFLWDWEPPGYGLTWAVYHWFSSELVVA